MGQKVSPHGLRVGVIKTWSSRWFAKREDIASTLYEDYLIRKFLKKKLYGAGIPVIEIERDTSKIKVHIHCSKPGVVIGKGGAEIEKLKASCEKLFKKSIFINIIEVKSPEINAQLIAENIAAQLEKRMSFRRAMKQAISRAMKRGAKGVSVRVAGRLNGAEIARAEHYHEGSIPRQTLRADIDYGFSEANTTYGKIGVKAWIYKGEVLKKALGPGKLSGVSNQKGGSAPSLDEKRKVFDSLGPTGIGNPREDLKPGLGEKRRAPGFSKPFNGGNLKDDKKPSLNRGGRIFASNKVSKDGVLKDNSSPRSVGGRKTSGSSKGTNSSLKDDSESSLSRKITVTTKDASPKNEEGGAK